MHYEICLPHLLSLGPDNVGELWAERRREEELQQGWLHVGGAYLAIVIMISESWVSSRLV